MMVLFFKKKIVYKKRAVARTRVNLFAVWGFHTSTAALYQQHKKWYSYHFLNWQSDSGPWLPAGESDCVHGHGWDRSISNGIDRHNGRCSYVINDVSPSPPGSSRGRGCCSPLPSLPCKLLRGGGVHRASTPCLRGHTYWHTLLYICGLV
jgi:hypothetical protein